MKAGSCGTDLFMKRWILLMKSDEVKTLTQNYLAFYPTAPIRLNFPDSILPGPLFSSILALLDTPVGPYSLLLRRLLIFHRLKEIRPLPIRTDRTAQPLGLYRKVPPSHEREGWGKIQ